MDGVEQNNIKELEEISKSNEDYRETGYNSLNKEKSMNLDYIYSALIGVLGGVISSLIPFSLLIKLWYPFTGGTQLVSGHHVIWGAIIYGLTKKKKNIILTMVTKGILEFLLGHPYGLLILFVNILEGALLSFGFYVMAKIGEGETKVGWGIAGGIGNFIQAPFIWILNQRWYLHWSLWALAFIFAFISGILITGLLGRAMKNSLIKAGVPITY
ncbi:MAG: ECF transporter S component [Candidatus Lokiarchaeota archaeon]|nr:ECF transporter S component [Candidatus Lokiarchaeota archaeon]